MQDYGTEDNGGGTVGSLNLEKSLILFSKGATTTEFTLNNYDSSRLGTLGKMELTSNGMEIEPRERTSGSGNYRFYCAWNSEHHEDLTEYNKVVITYEVRNLKNGEQLYLNYGIVANYRFSDLSYRLT